MLPVGPAVDCALTCAVTDRPQSPKNKSKDPHPKVVVSYRDASLRGMALGINPQGAFGDDFGERGIWAAGAEQFWVC
jgi:hypothetical protein